MPKSAQDQNKENNLFHIPAQKIKNLSVVFRDVEASLFQWRARIEFYLDQLEKNLLHIQSQLSIPSPSQDAKARLQVLLEGYGSQKKSIKKIMSDFLNQQQLADLQRVFRYRIPRHQHLESYEPTIFRDWCWGENENTQALKFIIDIWPKQTETSPGFFSVWGSGASRLSYDLLNTLPVKFKHTFICDFNPMLLTIAEKMFSGQTIELVEFPLNPIDRKNLAVKRKLSAPKTYGLANIDFVLCDLTEEVFKKNSLDLIFTPWFIDIVSDEMTNMIRKINRAIKTNGHWIFYGPLGFNRADITENYTIEDLISIAGANGFELVESQRMRMPYLQSDISGQHRSENVLGCTFKKISDSGDPTYKEFLPEWIVNIDLPIPQKGLLEAKIGLAFYESQILGRIDGKKSVREIAKAISAQFNIPQTQAELAVLNMVTII